VETTAAKIRAMPLSDVVREQLVQVLCTGRAGVNPDPGL